MSMMEAVTIFKNGTNTNGESFVIGPMTWGPIDGLMRQVARRFELSSDADLKFYAADGREVSHCRLIGDSQTLYYATSHEDFIQPPPQQRRPASLDDVVTTSFASVEAMVIKLNVGGILFQTTVGTLMKDPNSKLSKMFGPISGERIPPPLKYEGAYFLDRDPKYFAPILNYLQTGRLVLKTEVSIVGVVEEAIFFNVRACIPPNWETSGSAPSALTYFVASGISKE